MKTRTKVVLSVSMVCLLAVIAVAAVVGVWAATRQTLTSEISVTYKATGITGSALANVIKYDDETANFKSTAMTGAANFVVGDENDNDQTLTPAPGSATLSAEEKKDFIVFEYIFKNGSESVPYTAKLAYADTSNDDKNFDIYFLGSEDAKDVTSTEWLTVVGAEGNKKTTSLTGLGQVEVPVKEQDTEGTYYAYVLVKISNTSNDMTFTGKFTWTLTSGVEG